MKRNIGKFFIFLLIAQVLIFQNVLQEYFYYFKYIDELIAYAPLVYIILIVLLKKRKIFIEEIKILNLMFLIFVVGILGNVLFRYQKIPYAIMDILIVFKFLFSYFFARIVFRNFDLRRYSKYINIIISINTIVLFIVFVLDNIIKIFPRWDVRYGIESIQIFFSHPTYLASSCIILLTILTALLKKYKTNYMYIFLNIIMIIFTLRIKAIVFVIVYVIGMYCIVKNKKIKFRYIIFVIPIIFFVSINRIKEQVLINETYARHVLNKYSLIILKDHFPIGSGFGTFGSYVSGKYYSEIYYKYSINNIYGIEKGAFFEVTDNFWPMILGQLGLIGSILFILILFYLFKIIIKGEEKDRFFKFAKLMPIVYLIITSSSESSFANYMAVVYLFLTGILVNSTYLHIKEEKKNE